MSFRISSLESPDRDLERSPRGLAARPFFHEAERNWGRGSALWDAHVEGIFPRVSTQSLLEPAWLARCFDPSLSLPAARGPRVLAVDLCAGRGADRFVALVRDRYGLLALRVSNRAGVPEAARQTSELAQQFKVPQDRIVYDAGGLLGFEMKARLRDHGITRAKPYHGSAEGPSDNPAFRFLNLRALVGWRLRERLDPDTRLWRERERRPRDIEGERIAGEYERCGVPWAKAAPTFEPPPDRQPPFAIPAHVLGEHRREFEEELKGLRWRTIPNGEIALEKKEDFAERLGRSPDLADALLMSMHLGD